MRSLPSKEKPRQHEHAVVPSPPAPERIRLSREPVDACVEVQEIRHLLRDLELDEPIERGREVACSSELHLRALAVPEQHLRDERMVRTVVRPGLAVDDGYAHVEQAARIDDR